MTKKKNKTCLLTALILAGFSLYSAPSYARDMTEYPRVKLQSLDKATARTETFEAKVGATLKFGPLYMKVQSCQKSSPIDQPESAAFLQIWEVDPNEEAHWVFSGWMFASSPGLSAMNHPIYDVWVIDCLDHAENIQEDAAETTDDAPPAPSEQETGDTLEEQ